MMNKSLSLEEMAALVSRKFDELQQGDVADEQTADAVLKLLGINASWDRELGGYDLDLVDDDAYLAEARDRVVAADTATNEILEAVRQGDHRYRHLGNADVNEIFDAVRQVLTAGEDEICDANLHLLETSIKHCLVSEDECNTG